MLLWFMSKIGNVWYKIPVLAKYQDLRGISASVNIIFEIFITHSFTNSRWGQTGCCQTFDSFWGLPGSTFGDCWCSRLLFFCCSKENVCQKNYSNEKLPRFYAVPFDEICSGWSLGSIQIGCWSTNARWNWFV